MTKSVADEQVSQSEFSCGLIRDNEDVIRIIVYPHHMEKGALTLKTAAFNREELLSDGVSIERKELTDPEKLTASSQNLLTSTIRSIAGYAVVECSSVRAIVDGMGVRVFCILDTALKYNPAHGDIFFAQDLSRPDQIKYRERLVSAFNERISSYGSLYQAEELFEA